MATVLAVVVINGCSSGDGDEAARVKDGTQSDAPSSDHAGDAAPRGNGEGGADGSTATGGDETTICRSASSLDIFDAAGKVDPAKYRALAAAFASKEAVGFRFGHDAAHYHATPQTFPTAYVPPDHEFGHGFNQPKSTYQIGGPFEDDPGGYNTSAGQVLYVPDDATAPGVDAVQFLEVASNVVSEKPMLSWTAYGGGVPDQGTIDADMVQAHGGPFRAPVAVARAVTTDQWTQDAIVAFQDGSLLTTGTHASGGSSYVLTKLPSGLVPTSIALTTNNELALVTVWDTANVRGGLAVVALGGPKSPKWWGDWGQVYPGLHNYGLFSFMKVLGVVWLDGMTAPIAVAASADIRRPMLGAPEPGTLDLSDETTRQRFMVGGDLAVRHAAGGFAVVLSRSEKKAAFVDLQPLFASIAKSYFETRADFERTRSFGPAPTDWPETFDVVPSAAPTVVKMLDLTSCPTSAATSINVFAPNNFPDANDNRHTHVDASFDADALIGTDDGTLHVFSVGGLRDDTAADATSIREVDTLTVGQNPTSIVPLGRTNGEFGNPVDYVVVSRGDRRVTLLHGNPKSHTLTAWKTIEDSRLVDPVTVEDVTWFGNYVPLIEVADFGGRQVVAYRYDTASLPFYGNAQLGLGSAGTDAFECGGVYPTPGGALFVSSTNVP